MFLQVEKQQRQSLLPDALGDKKTNKEDNTCKTLELHFKTKRDPEGDFCRQLLANMKSTIAIETD